MGKNKWPQIEQGMIDWHASSGQNDPAGDLANVTLILPTPPMSAYAHQQQHNQIYSQQRLIRPMPTHNRARIASNVTRTVSVIMASPDQFTSQLTSQAYGYTQEDAPPPLYGEDEVPMTVRMPTGRSSDVPGSATSLAPFESPWEGMTESKGMKRERSVSDHNDNADEGRSGEDLGFGQQTHTIWQE